ncbi:MAG: helicase-related protein, partial [Pseudobdellovibrionaceae bacterium]
LAFGIPWIAGLVAGATTRNPRALILCPTRALATQVSAELRKASSFAKIRIATIYGGSSYQRQIEVLRMGIDVIVATPGRLIDLLNQRLLTLNEVRTVILDEADKMVSMGFKEDLETILQAATNADAPFRTWLFSATMHPGVKSIAKSYLKEADEVNLTTEERVSQHTTQYYISCFGKDRSEIALRIVQGQADFYGIIFCQTKQEVDHLGQAFIKNGLLAETIHGDRTQLERERTLTRFKTKKIKILIATDVAARGIDVQDLTHVVNLSFPFDFETYIHRVGRTGRNGNAGTAITLISPSERSLLFRLEKKIGVQIGQMPAPSPKQMANSMLSALQADLISHLEREKQMIRAKEVLNDFQFDEKILSLPTQDLLAAMMLKFNSSVFFFKELETPQARSGGFGGDRRGGDRRDDRGGGRGYGGRGGSWSRDRRDEWDRGGSDDRREERGDRRGGFARRDRFERSDRRDDGFRGGDRRRNDFGGSEERRSFGDRSEPSGEGRFGRSDRSFRPSRDFDGGARPAPRADFSANEGSREERPARARNNRYPAQAALEAKGEPKSVKSGITKHRKGPRKERSPRD